MPDSYSRGYIGNVFVDLSSASTGQFVQYDATAHAVVPKTLVAADISDGAALLQVRSQEVTFTEAAQAGAGTYTADVTLPAGATLIDIIVYAGALWNDGTSASLDVGDFTTGGVEINANGYYAGVNLKATDLLADQSLSFAEEGGKGGAYFAGSGTHINNRYSATARKIRTTVAVGAGAGTTGQTRVTVVYSIPSASTAATFA